MNDFELIEELQKKIVDDINEIRLPLTTVYYVLGSIQKMVRDTVTTAQKGAENANPDTDNKG